jgi:hypothetical protein
MISALVILHLSQYYRRTNHIKCSRSKWTFLQEAWAVTFSEFYHLPFPWTKRQVRCMLSKCNNSCSRGGIYSRDTLMLVKSHISGRCLGSNGCNLRVLWLSRKHINFRSRCLWGCNFSYRWDPTIIRCKGRVPCILSVTGNLEKQVL